MWIFARVLIGPQISYLTCDKITDRFVIELKRRVYLGSREERFTQQNDTKALDGNRIRINFVIFGCHRYVLYVLKSEITTDNHELR